MTVNDLLELLSTVENKDAVVMIPQHETQGMFVESISIEDNEYEVVIY